MAFEDVATLLIVLDADDRASEKIDRAKHAIEEYAAAVDAAAADTAVASSAMGDEFGAFTGTLDEGVTKAVDDFERFHGDLSALDNEFQRFSGHLEEVAQPTKDVTTAVDGLNNKVGEAQQRFQAAESEVERMHSVMKPLEADFVDLDQVTEDLNNGLSANQKWWGKFAGTAATATTETAKLNTALEKGNKDLKDVEQAGKDTEKALEDADNEVKKLSPDFDKAMNSAEKLAQKLFLLKNNTNAASSSTSGFAKWTGILAAVLSTLAGPISALIAMSVPAVFLGIGFAAFQMKQSIDQAQASGQKLTAVQQAMLPIVNTITAAYNGMKPALAAVGKEIGNTVKALDPAFKTAVAALNPMLISAGNGISNFLSIMTNGLAPTLKSMIPIIDQFWAGMAVLAHGFVGMIQNIDMNQAAQGIRDLLNAIGQLLPILGHLLTAFMPIGHAVLGVLLPPILQFADALIVQLQPVLAAIGPILGYVGSELAQFAAAIEPILPPLSQLAVAMLPGFMSVLKAILPLIVQGTGAIITVLVPIVQWIAANPKLAQSLGVVLAAWLLLRTALMANPWVALITAVIVVATFIVDHWTQIKNFLVGLWHDIENIAKSVWNAVKDFFVSLWNDVKDFFVGVWDAIRDFVVGIIAQIVGYFIAQWVALEQFFTGLWNGMINTVKSIWNAIKNFFVQIIGNIVAGFISEWNQVKNFFSGLWNSILTIIGDAGKWLVNVGKDLITGLWNGITGALGWLWDKIKGIGQGIVNEFKSFLHIFSPSQMMADEVGKYIPMGIAKGITDNAHFISDAAKKATQTSVAGAQAGLNVTSQLNAGNAVGAGGGVGVQLIFTGNQVMNDQSIQQLATLAGQQVAKYMLPQAGHYIRM